MANLKNAIASAKQTLVAQNAPLLDDILTQIVIATLNKQQEKVGISIQDCVKSSIDQLRVDLEDSINNLSQSWIVGIKKEPTLFPKNCRFIYSRGSNTVIVIEQDPTIRTLYINSKTHCLPIPYCIFVFHFKNDSFVSVYHTWRTEPLQSLTDKLYNPILPNIHQNYSVCLGSEGFLGDYNTVCTNIINHFWSSTFNNDLNEFWNQIGLTDVKSLKLWEKGNDDPFFFNDKKLKKSSHTLQSLINLCIASNPGLDAIALRKKLSEQIDQCTKALFVRIIKHIKSAKFDKFYPQDIKKDLETVLDVVFQEIEEILTKLESKIPPLDQSYGWKKGGDFWQD